MGLSPVSVIGHCEQATPPITPRVRGDSRIRSLGDLLSNASACVSAWHPREAETRPLPPCPCLAPSPPPVTGRRWLRTFPCGKFEQGFLDEYGPAQVGLGPPFTRKDRTVCDLANNTCGSHHTRWRRQGLHGWHDRSGSHGQPRPRPPWHHDHLPDTLIEDRLGRDQLHVHRSA